MKNYRNASGNSNVTGYESGTGYLKVKFADGSIYEYTDESCGKNTLSRMKSYAFSGKGLNGLISRERPKYKDKS